MPNTLLMPLDTTWSVGNPKRRSVCSYCVNCLA